MGFSWTRCAKNGRTPRNSFERIYSSRELMNNITGVETISEMYSVAYLVVDENEMIAVRDALKPHRGEWYEE